jgi:protein-tyrosine phosphatase
MDNFKTALLYYSNKVLTKLSINSVLFHSRSPIDHIIDHIYLGDLRAADDTSILQLHEITHIINCAVGLPETFPENYKYLSLNLRDDTDQDLSEAFKVSLEFLKDKNAKVFIHCKQGVSRSASIVLAYLIMEKGLSYNEAFEVLVKKRNVVRPNTFFEQQLKQLAEKSKKEKSNKMEEEKGIDEL